MIKNNAKYKCFSSGSVVSRDAIWVWAWIHQDTLCDGIKSEGEPRSGFDNSLSGFLTQESLSQRNAALQLCLGNAHTHRAEADRLGFASDVATFAFWRTAKSLEGPLSGGTVAGVG